MKKGISFVEVILTILILGILSVVGIQIVTSLYNNYIQTRIVNILENKTELLTLKISNLLQQRIKSSTIARKLNPVTDITKLSVNNEGYQILEWLGYDNDSFLGYYDDNIKYNRPSWTGFVDLYNTNTDKNHIYTSGSNLAQAQKTIYNYSNHKVDLASNNKAGIVFIQNKLDFNVTQFGWNCFSESDPQNCQHRDYVFNVQCDDNICSKPILKATPSFKSISEHYYLTYSAYAIVPENNSLYLYYNYRPWNGDKYTDGEKSLLAENVSVFKFTQIDQMVRIKVCMYYPVTSDFKLTVCKERSVL